MSSPTKVLLVDDDPQSLESTRKILEFSGFQVTTASDGQHALDQVRPSLARFGESPHASGDALTHPPAHPSGHLGFDLVITDVRMPRLGGLEFLRALSLCGETMPVILMTAYGRVEDAVWAMKLGAVDFLTKPFKRQTLLSSVEAALKRSRSRAVSLSNGVGGVSGGGLNLDKTDSIENALIGRSLPIQELKNMIRLVAPTHVNVLLTGESGTGKELVARCLHSQSSRSQKNFIALNCGAVPEQLIESELFGFEKGAFSGAVSAKEGLFEAAHGGTLLLDEIGDMPFSLQVKLLRALQEREVRRLGSTHVKKIDVRVIAASHKDLKQCVQEGTFRQDLLYRLEVVGIHVPPLRDRKDDIVELANYFLKIAASRHSKPVQGMADSVLEALLSYPWPGNVRELSNVIERAVVFLEGAQMTCAELPAHLLSAQTQVELKNELQNSIMKQQSFSSISIPLGTSLKEVEELLIRKTLEATSGDKNMTAKLLGINSRTIYRKLDKRSDKDTDF